MKKILIIFLLTNIGVFSAINIKVGAYPFPPYLNVSDKTPSGKTVELIGALNRIQNKYNFQLVVTAPSRRFSDFGKKFDLMFYEDLGWGWKNTNLDSAGITLRDEEVFISLTSYYKDTNFVKDIKTKKILLIKGFHYAFANYNSSEDFLNKNFNVVFSTSPQNTIDFLFSGRAQIAIITKSFLMEYLKKNPSIADKILINETPDQVYKLTMIRNLDALISIDELNTLLKKVKDSKESRYLLE